MARDFTKNSNNYMLLGPNAIGSQIDGATAVSLHAWIVLDSYSPVSLLEGPKNVIFASFAGGGSFPPLHDGFLTLLIDGDGKLMAISSPPGVFNYTLKSSMPLSLGMLYSVGFVLNITNKEMRLYLNGNAIATRSLTIGVTAYNHVTAPSDVHDSIGTYNVPDSADTPWDGMLSEFSIYDADIGDEGFAALTGGIDPLAMNPLPVFYLDLGRFDLRCPLSGIDAEVFGTLGQRDHPPITYAPLCGSQLEHRQPIGGPYRVGARDIHHAGSQAGGTFVAGQRQGDIHLAGSVVGESR